MICNTFPLWPPPGAARTATWGMSAVDLYECNKYAVYSSKQPAVQHVKLDTQNLERLRRAREDLICTCDNIRSAERWWDALKQAQAYRLVFNFPEAWDTA